MNSHVLPVVLLAVASSCGAEPVVSKAPCAYTSVGTVDFRSASSRDRLTVSISGGPCAAATLTLEIRSGNRQLLYRFRNSVANLLLPVLGEDSLPEEAKQMVKEMARTKMAELAERLSLEEIKSGPASDLYTLQVSESEYRTHLLARNRVFTHPTYYEGGVTVVYDAASGKAKVLYSWGA